MNEQPRAGYDPLENLSEPKPGFASSRTQLLAALAMFPAAYAYVRAMLWGPYQLIALVAALLIAATEALHWQVKRSWESWVWLGCFAAVTLSAALGIERVWYLRQTILFVHIFAVWWVLSRSGKLLEGKSGHLLPLDAVNGFVLLPFGGFFLRLLGLGLFRVLLFLRRLLLRLRRLFLRFLLCRLLFLSLRLLLVFLTHGVHFPSKPVCCSTPPAGPSLPASGSGRQRCSSIWRPRWSNPSAWGPPRRYSPAYRPRRHRRP